jgi:hypothetical protein
MCTGAWRPFLQERHFSEASSGVSRGRRMASSGRLARVLHLMQVSARQRCARD